MKHRISIAPDLPLKNGPDVVYGGDVERKRISIIPQERIVLEKPFSESLMDTDWDGVRYLGAESKLARCLWIVIIVVFAFLSFLQIYFQFTLYMRNPITTYITAKYPEQMPFPSIAICNTNMFRLSYLLETARIRSPGNRTAADQMQNENTSTVYEKILANNWDKDAVDFLTEAAHQFEDMIIRCIMPDGTKCNRSHFSPHFTINGLCWAFNTNVRNPFLVGGSGPESGLQLLLNVENYERVEDVNCPFISKSPPGVKVTVFNTTEGFDSANSGMVVPAGFLMNVPLTFKRFEKLPSSGCARQGSENDFLNMKSCRINLNLLETAKECNCTMERLYIHRNVSVLNIPGLSSCNVKEYFDCVQNVQRKVRQSSELNQCEESCETSDFQPIQEITRLPRQLMPVNIDDVYSLEEVEMEEIEAEEHNISKFLDAGYQKIIEPLNEDHADYITMKASNAYELQLASQGSSIIRMERLLLNLVNARKKIFESGWGWRNEEFKGVFTRINESIECFSQVYKRHNSLGNLISRLQKRNEERGRNMFYVTTDADSLLSLISRMWNVFLPTTYTPRIAADLSEMDENIDTAAQILSGASLKQWAVDMDDPEKLFFVDEDFKNGWYKVIVNDLNNRILKPIKESNRTEKRVIEYLGNQETMKTFGRTFFGSESDRRITNLTVFVNEMKQCFAPLEQRVVHFLFQFKTLHRKFQKAYDSLFEKELRNIKEKFEFGESFERENFAIVNFYYSKMMIETWTQQQTYTFWSLASDIGGSLGLFLGASLVSIIEVLYLIFHYGCAVKIKKWWR